MLKMQIIGYLGRDASVQQNGTESVVNMSVAHTDKFKNAAGVVTEKATWVSCSWWIDAHSPVIQYLKKGTLVWIEGVPEAKMWKSKENKYACGLGIRIFSLQLLGGRKDGDQGSPTQQSQQQEPQAAGFVPYSGDEPPF